MKTVWLDLEQALEKLAQEVGDPRGRILHRRETQAIKAAYAACRSADIDKKGG